MFSAGKPVDFQTADLIVDRATTTAADEKMVASKSPRLSVARPVLPTIYSHPQNVIHTKH